jgi:hypothetical protein
MYGRNDGGDAKTTSLDAINHADVEAGTRDVALLPMPAPDDDPHANALGMIVMW